MAAINWPSSLPLPLADGYGETPPSTTIRTKMDSGPDKVRRRSTAAPRPFTLRYHLTREQIEALDYFFCVTTRGGSLRFNWTNPRTGAACKARFVEPPSYSAIEHEGSASARIEVLP